MSKNGSGRKRTKSLIIIIGLTLVVTLLAYYLISKISSKNTTQHEESRSKETDKLLVAFLTPGSATDLGYNFQINQGRIALEAQLRDEIRTTIWQGVSVSDANNVIQRFCDNGAKLIFSADPQYIPHTQAAAQNNTDVKFMQFFSSQRSNNIGTYAIHDWEPTYVCGVAAALTAQDKTRFAFIGPKPVFTAKWTVNAFALGARSINDKITVEMVYTGSWYDPKAERAAVEQLADKGIEVVYVFLISPITAVQTAENIDLYVLSHFSDLSWIAPKKWITGTTWNWHKIFIEVTALVLKDSWEPKNYGGGFKEGYATIAPFGPDVNHSAQEKVRQTIRMISSGELNVFAGPIKDNHGNLKVPGGDTMTIQEILSTDWLVEGVRDMSGEEAD